jgi:hypothetical protein
MANASTTTPVTRSEGQHASLPTAKIQHSSEPLEEFLSLGTMEQEAVMQEMIRKANLYDDMERLAQEERAALRMEHFFTPSRRLQDRYGFDSDESHIHSEVQLTVSIEEFLNHSWDCSDFRPLFACDEDVMRKIIWITEDTYISVEDENTGREYDERLEDYAIQRAALTATSGETHYLVLATVANGLSPLVGAVSVFWFAVTSSNCVTLRLRNRRCEFGLLFGTARLQFLETSPSLHLLEFRDFAFDEADCRALATLERTGLEVTFEECSFDAQDAEDIFIEWMRHSQVVTKLENCKSNDIIISALSGNSSIKSLSYDRRGGDDIIRSLAGTLPGNQGIEILRVSLQTVEIWSLLLRSLWTHPRIQSLSLVSFPRVALSLKTRFMKALLRLAQCNTVVNTIDLPHNFQDEEFFQNSIVPRLEMNRNCFADQRRALKRADPSIRGQLLGRALHVVRYNPNLLFRFLSENVPAFVRSEEDDPIITSGQKRKARP